MPIPSIDNPMQLDTAVIYFGEPALIVARAKPVGSPWLYDLLMSRDHRLQIVTGAVADDLEPLAQEVGE